MSHYSAIASVINRIMFAVDHTDRELFKSCWSPNLKFKLLMFDGTQIEFMGRDELVEKSTKDWDGKPRRMRHAVCSIDVALIDDFTATAHFYCTYINVGESPAIVGMGEYEDILVRDKTAGWQVSERFHRFLTPLQLNH